VKIEILAVDRLRSAWAREAVDEYLERIGRYCPVERKDVKRAGEGAEAVAAEAARAIGHTHRRVGVHDAPLVVVADPGREHALSLFGFALDVTLREKVIVLEIELRTFAGHREAAALRSFGDLGPHAVELRPIDVPGRLALHEVELDRVERQEPTISDEVAQGPRARATFPRAIAAPAANPHLDRVKGPGQRRLWLAHPDLDVVHGVLGEDRVGDRRGQRLQQVERALADDPAGEVEEGRVVDRIGQFVGPGRPGEVEAQHEVHLERLRRGALLVRDAVATREPHPPQRDPVAHARHLTIPSATRTVFMIGSTSWTRTISAPAAIASATLAAVPSSRSSGAAPPRSSPMTRFRLVPTSSGSPPSAALSSAKAGLTFSAGSRRRSISAGTRSLRPARCRHQRTGASSTASAG